MNITVCSMENRVSSGLYRIVHHNHASYCEKNAYGYYEVNCFSKYEQKPTPHWHKFDVIYDALLSSDYAFWIDFDAVFTNFSIRIESFIEQDIKILMSRDSRGRQVQVRHWLQQRRHSA